MRVNIKNISLFSAFKMGCVVSGILTLFLMGPYLLCSLTGTASLVNLLPRQTALSLGCLSSTVTLGLLVFAGSLVAGALSWTFSALVYNIAAIITGGLNVKLRRRGRKSAEFSGDDEQEDDPVLRAAGKNLHSAEAFLNRQKKKNE